ncbi:MAG: FAD-dependent oxidoreductase [Desulfomicrobium sp.]|nr:FAD-dependent oxidoreductase [Pseudomonadota bacterium]MBV1713533.1 FAD-dependent oxidoreductase [Desulfomicrobium sp.]MBU4572069.1 FAD-dependent oxidoreductase [Pseudomonadota bacterium]MBU4594047.1 FAD-dependent oxidoreductase [Pseudomonadota bacterium]MBV1721002.1 FAD-dependent oxidoreductase [Desulfomicrobium sp.]
MAKSKNTEWFLPEDQRKALAPYFKDFKEVVPVHLFVKAGQNDAYADFAHNLMKDLVRLTDKVTLSLHSDDAKASDSFAVTRFPTLLIAPEKYSIRFTGAPAGEEGQAFLHALMMVSTGNSFLSERSRELLQELQEPRVVKVFVSPTCPYCPGQCVNAIKAAVEKPKLVSVECVETGENPDYAQEYSVGSIPHTVYDEKLSTVGMESELAFVLQLLTLTAAKDMAQEEGRADKDVIHHDLVIIGSGPAGLTAGIYAKRAGLDAVVLEKGIVGGLVSITPEVENYPGFINIGGKMLMDMIHEQAKQYVDVITGQTVEEIKVGRNLEVLTQDQVYVADSVIYAAGASWKKLGVPGEDRFMSKGVSFCASCDGFMFKGKKVAVVGGGNTALTDALHLKNLGVDVFIVHRRDSFRAEQHLVDSVLREEIPVHWNSVVEEIGGKETLTFITVRHIKTGETERVPVDGVFLAIGIVPNVQAVSHLGLAQEPGGYIRVDRLGRTSIPRIYAAGDITGGVQQIVTAVSEGASAAMAVFEDQTRRKAESAARKA